jgi:hypothetical protein
MMSSAALTSRSAGSFVGGGGRVIRSRSGSSSGKMVTETKAFGSRKAPATPARGRRGVIRAAAAAAAAADAKSHDVDVVVIGAGIGGLCAGALLAKYGLSAGFYITIFHFRSLPPTKLFYAFISCTHCEATTL